MRTCDCGWIADWDLGDKRSCTLYMLGSDVGAGEPPGRGPAEDKAQVGLVLLLLP